MKTFIVIAIIFSFLFPAMAQRKSDPEIYLGSRKKKLNIIFKASQFKAGDRVADIGAGDGWFDAAVGIYMDSLSFCLEEIDSAFMKKEKFQEAFVAYEKIRGSPITCSYSWAIGTEKSTNLPGASFDKILLMDTYHHMDFREEMIRDIFYILKPGGKLIVNEPVGRKPGKIYKTCNTIVYTPVEIISAITDAGFSHNITYKTVKSNGTRVRVFVFSKL